MATSGQFYWPSVGSSVAAYGQFSMAANTGSSENQKLAWKFIEFTLGSLEGQEAMRTARAFTPGFVPMYSTEGFTDPDEFFAGESPSKIFVDGVTQPNIAVSNYSSDYARAIKLLTDAQTKVMLSGADPKEALDEAAQLLSDQTGRKVVG